MEPSPVGSHVRRKFFDIHQAHASPLAAEAIARIGQLYAIETEISGRERLCRILRLSSGAAGVTP